MSFSVEEGEIFGIIGPNGAGKMTTVESIVGLRNSDAGSIRVLGLDRADRAELRPSFLQVIRELGACRWRADSARRRASLWIGRTRNSGDRRACSVAAADWNKGIIDEFHARGGKGIGHFGDKLLLLTTRGAKSGQVRTTPLVYHRDGDRYVIAASKGGAPAHPGWYHNLVKDREAEIEVGTERFKVRAMPIPKGLERDRLYEAHGEKFAAFRDYPKRTKRVIPVVVLQRVS